MENTKKILEAIEGLKSEVKSIRLTLENQTNIAIRFIF